MGVKTGVLSADPKRTRRRYSGIKCFSVSDGRLKAIIRAVMWCDIVVVGGGELVQDVSSLFYTPFNLLPLFLAFLFRKKSFAWAVGIGQMHELAPLTPLLVRIALWFPSGITVRDRGSFNVLHRLGFREPEMILAADSALTLSDYPNEVKKHDILGVAPRNVLNRSGKFFPLEIRKKFRNYREPDPMPAADAWAGILDAFAGKYKSEIVMFPFHTGSLSNSDHEFCDLIKSRMNHSSLVRFADPAKPEEFTDMISQCRVFVTTPLHGAILSVVTGTVPVSVSYASKCSRFMEQIELEDYLIAEKPGIPNKSVAATIERAWMNSESVVERMVPVREKLVQRAGKTAEHFRAVFNI